MSGAQERPLVMKLDQWKGQNSQASRSAIDDQELYWSENLLPVGPGNLVMLPDNGPAIWDGVSGETITAPYAYVRSGQRYAIAFTSDGAAHEITLPGGTATVVAAAGTFSPATGYLPRVAAWGNSGILIVSSQTNGYWAWDGTLYASGDASPSWLNGGTPTNMPTGIKGNAITIYQSRAIVADGNKVSISAPSNGATFASSNGGTTFTSSDAFLQQAFMDLQQSSGFLYLFGDSSVNALSNLQTAGSPSVTTFYNANVDPQVGHAFPTPGVPFGRALIFGNSTGVFALLGGAARKISDKMDGLFATLDATVVPSFALAYLSGVKCLVVCLKCTRTVDGKSGNLLLIWDGEKWCVATQTAAMLQITMSMQDSAPQVWGTDGTKLYQCFGGSPSTIAARLVTKLYQGPDPLALKMLRSVFLDMNGEAAKATITVQTERGTQQAEATVSPVATWFNSSGDVATWSNNVPETVSWGYSGEQVIGQGISGTGLLFGFDTTLDATSLAVVRMMATFDNVTDIGR